ncbi:MAG: acetylornithine transaminase [Actinomycetaceae bacterium]|nr:acetylornithine transaminase [Actinomycetaceae bacterium]
MSTESNQALQNRYSHSLLNTFGQPQLVLSRGEGAYVWDADGKQYLDLLAGIAVNALGHAHPAVLEALCTQAKTLGHISNFFTSKPQIEAAEKLLSIIEPGGAPAGSKVFFSNSGTEANEAAFKIARLWGGSERPTVLALTQSFHGRSMGALALTYKATYREPYEPLPGGVKFIESGSVRALEEALDGPAGRQVAALFVEPIQGEAGVKVLDAQYLERARELTRNAGALLIVDEVQAGMGRTGQWMGHHSAGIVPDVITLAKGLGGGFPVGACITVGEDISAVMKPGLHGTTFGGNPLATAVALAVIETIEEENLLEHARAMGVYTKDKLEALASPLITEIRGQGLLIGIGLAVEAASDLAKSLLEAGFIVNAPNPSTLRLAPPLIISPQQIDSFVDTLDGLLKALGRADS